MTAENFPFPALVGLDTLKLALRLAAIDLRLSVLIRGDKGAGKSTAARGLSGLLEPGTPFINLPIGATEDRLLGGLDVEKALKGEPALKPGLLAAAHGGVLYVDEVNLLPDHLADALLDAVASGVHVLEREGFSASQAAQFVMIGSMNPEEGALRPQILDRFALAVDVTAPMEPALRSGVMARRLAFDADAAGFAQTWSDERTRLAGQLVDARARLPLIVLSDAILALIAERVIAHGVRSLRADLAAVRASRALAALEDSPAVEPSHVEAVLPLALAHRGHSRHREPSPDPPSQDRQRQSPDDAAGPAPAAAERVFAPLDLLAPRLETAHRAEQAGTSSSATAVGRGPVIGTIRTTQPRELDARATLVHAAVNIRGAAIGSEDLHERRRAPLAGTRYLFIVDSSGSHAVQERMRLVKGAVNGLLDAAHGRHDEIVVIACRGASASVLVEPTAILDDAQRALEYMPTGGRTPLAHAIELAATYVTDTSLVVVITDGHANVPSRTDDPWTDTLTAAAAIRCPSLVIDSEDPRQLTGQSQELAATMRARYLRLTELDQVSVLRLIRETV
jgi:magnesium chelatase subunit D